MKWFKYLLYKMDLWIPITTLDKLTIISLSGINPYLKDNAILVSTESIIDAISIMDEISGVDYVNDYLIRSNYVIAPARDTYLCSWYSSNNTILPPVILVKWSVISYRILQIQKNCLKHRPNSKAYRNGVKLKFLTDEITSIVDCLL